VLGVSARHNHLHGPLESIGAALPRFVACDAAAIGEEKIVEQARMDGDSRRRRVDERQRCCRDVPGRHAHAPVELLRAAQNVGPHGEVILDIHFVPRRRPGHERICDRVEQGEPLKLLITEYESSGGESPPQRAPHASGRTNRSELADIDRQLSDDQSP